MWRRVSSSLRSVTIASSKRSPSRFSSSPSSFLARKPDDDLTGSSFSYLRFISGSSTPLGSTSPHFSLQAASDALGKKQVEAILPIATGHEREEIEFELDGKKRFDMDAPTGSFGTKDEPAIVQSYYNKRIVGCVGGEGEDEHDVVWFWLQKDKPVECCVCSQYFKLEVIGEGGPVGDEDDDHH